MGTGQTPLAGRHDSTGSPIGLAVRTPKCHETGRWRWIWRSIRFS